MTAHDPVTARSAKLIAQQPRRAIHSLESPDILRLARGLVVFAPTGEQIHALVEMARNDLPGITTSDIVRRVVTYNPDSLWAIAHADHFDARNPIGEGLLAFLFLREEGLRQLVAGTFNAADPDLSLLARQNEKPAGIYVWCCHAKGRLAAGVPLALQKVWTPLYRDLNLYSRSINSAAVKFVEGMGFRREAKYAGYIAPHLHVYRRGSDSAEAPAYDTHDARATSPREISVAVVRTMDGLLQAVAIRSAVFIAEQECPYAEEFDGNDFAATHLIGFVGDDPAGCIRLRWFADFVKVERLAVRKEFRQTRLAFALIKGAIELGRKKGYRRFYGHAQKRLTDFWSRFGFRPRPGAPEFVFSDFDYIEMEMWTDAHPEPIRVGCDPYVTVRPEGRWHTPGILEQSIVRGVTRPSVAEGMR